MRILTIMIFLLLAFTVLAQKPTKYNLKTGDKFLFTSLADQSIEQMQMQLGQKVMTQEEIEVLSFADGIYTMKSTNFMQSFAMTGGQMEQNNAFRQHGLNEFTF